MIEDIVEIQSQYNLRSEYTREAGYALSRDIDNFVLGLRADVQGYNTQSNVVYNTDTGAVGGTYIAINEASILAANQILDEALVPMDGRRLIISPGQKADMMTIDRFVNSDYVNNKPIATGQIGSIYGIPIIVSNNLVANSATGYVNGTGGATQPTPGVTGSPYFPTQTHPDATATTLPTGTTTAILFHPDWAILSMQLNPKTESSRENLYQANAVVSTQIYGAKSYRLDHAVLVHTAS